MPHGTSLIDTPGPCTGRSHPAAHPASRPAARRGSRVADAAVRADTGWTFTSQRPAVRQLSRTATMPLKTPTYAVPSGPRVIGAQLLS